MRAAGVILSILLASSSMAFADDDDDFATGLEHQQAGRFAAAVVAFQRAQAKHPSPETKLHLAECEVGAGRWLRAEEHFREVIAAPVANGFGATAKAELAALTPRIPRLRIVVFPFDEPLPVRVEVDGDVVTDALPATVRVDPGTHRVVATSTAHERAAETVVAKDGTTTQVNLELMPGPMTPDTGRTAVRGVGFALIGTGAAGAAMGTIFAFLGSLQNICFSFGRSDCPRDGDPLLVAALGVGLFSAASFVVGGVLLGISGRRYAAPKPPRRDPEIPDSEIFGATLRVPTWYDERPRVPSLPATFTVFARSF